MPRLISADKLESDMYHNAFEIDTDLQKWDSGCWIRYKMFENVIEEQPTVDAIPIEWIQNKYIERWKKAEMGRHDFQFVEVIDDLLEMWEKESESRDTEGIK